MAYSTGYPCCSETKVEKYGFNTEASCILSCKKDDIPICVEPEITCIEKFSLVGVNADGIAVQLTVENYKDVMACCSEVYFTICAIKPRDPGKQRYFMAELKVASHCINWKAMLADTPEKQRELIILARRKGILITDVQVN
ncbi:hypothetical protein ACH42_06350 [Endozoicomonas sp. (ex Bugula neritina AB1)]|nr:hypothetical protein ACH42_06350 [Endozoicomonas sp. (ex Bugula neritina AB1)]